MRKDAGGGAELQERNVLALGDGAGQLRLRLDDLEFGETADQVDIVDGEINDDADIRHPRRKRSDPGDADGKNILARDRLLDRGDRRVEALDMTDHQRDARRCARQRRCPGPPRPSRPPASQPGCGCCA